MSDQLLTITPSNINFMSCHLKWESLVQKRQYGGTKGSSPALRYGIGVHDVLGRLYHQPSPYDLNQLPLYTRAAFAKQPYKAEEDREHDMRRSSVLVPKYMGEMDDDIEEVMAVERTGVFPVTHKGQYLYRAYARLDLMFTRKSDPRTLVVRDWRIGSQKSLEVEQIWLNLAVAKFLAPAYDRYLLEIDSLNDDTGVDRLCYSSKTLKGVVHLVTERVLTYINAPSHEPTPGTECLWCAYAPQCKAHQSPAIEASDLDF